MKHKEPPSDLPDSGSPVGGSACEVKRSVFRHLVPFPHGPLRVTVQLVENGVPIATEKFSTIL